jgi:hypothetical protein
MLDQMVLRSAVESAREFVHGIAVVRDLRTRRRPYARANLLFIAPEAKAGTDGMSDKTPFVVVHSIMSRMDVGPGRPLKVCA